MSIISISGRIGCGKDTAADYLVNNYGYTRIAFADSVKDVLAVVFGWNRELLAGHTIESRIWREQPDVWWSEKLNIVNFTPRRAMLEIGTGLFRNHFDDTIWIHSLERKIQPLDKVVITDTRFLNEFNACKRMNAVTVRVERGEYPIWYNHLDDIEWLHENKIHPSEYESVKFQYDYIIQNSDLDGFYKKLDGVV